MSPDGTEPGVGGSPWDTSMGPPCLTGPGLDGRNLAQRVRLQEDRPPDRIAKPRGTHRAEGSEIPVLTMASREEGVPVGAAGGRQAGPQGRDPVPAPVQAVRR